MTRQCMVELLYIYVWKVFNYKNKFLKMFQGFLKATLSYWKEVTGQYWDKVLV